MFNKVEQVTRCRRLLLPEVADRVIGRGDGSFVSPKFTGTVSVCRGLRDVTGCCLVSTWEPAVCLTCWHRHRRTHTHAHSHTQPSFSSLILCPIVSRHRYHAIHCRVSAFGMQVSPCLCLTRSGPL